MDDGAGTVPESTPPRADWRVVWSIWTAYGLLVGTQQFLVGRVFDRPEPLWRHLVLQLLLAWCWAALTPLILQLAHRFPFTRGRWRRSAAVHLAACVAVVFAIDVVYVVASRALGQPPAQPATTVMAQSARLFLFWVVADGLLYWAVVSVSYAVEHYRKYREGELLASRLEAQLAQAQLQALQSQLHPHFLFNALHTIGTLVRTGDTQTAVRVLAGLGDLLRRMLEQVVAHEVPLKHEVDFIRSYLEIEQVRFRDRLRVTIHVAPDTLDAAVPYLILQPLVENAIRHGIAPHVAGGTVLIGARRFNGRLVLTVRDDGLGIPDGRGPRPRVGLANTRARLERLFGRDFEFTIENAAEGGVEARMALPLRLAHAEWSPED